jgi:hypothetical protein
VKQKLSLLLRGIKPRSPNPVTYRFLNETRTEDVILPMGPDGSVGKLPEYGLLVTLSGAVTHSLIELSPS